MPETIKPVHEEDKIRRIKEGNSSVHQVYPVSRMAGDGRAEFSRAWGSGSEQEGAGGGARGSIKKKSNVPLS